jgi:TonB family protein
VPFSCALSLLSATHPARADEPAPAGQITRAPQLSHFVEATYPPDKKAAGITAKVVLSIDVGDDGKVGEVSVVQTGGADFDAAAVAAARQFVFVPAEIDGKPAPVRLTYEYVFKIETKMVSLGPQINFDGVILERFKKHPFPGVTITVVDLGVSATVGADGRFAFTDVPIGTHKVQLSGRNVVTVMTDEVVAKDRKTTVKYYVEERDVSVDEEVVVRATRIKKEAVQTTIRTEEARRVPGTQGDTLKVVQNLPGVARSSFGSGALIVWGSAPADTQVYVDGVPVPALYHLGGLRSTVNQDFVKSIELVPGAYGSEYDRGLGGVVKVETKDNDAPGIHGYVSADLLDTSAMISAQVLPDLHIDLAGRYSYLDRLLPLFTKENVGEFVPIPRYDDYQARISRTLRQDERVELVFLATDDALTNTIPSQDPTEIRTQTQTTSGKRGFIRYTRVMSDGSSISVTPSIGYDTNRQVLQFGPVPAVVDTTAWTYALRANFRQRLARLVVMSIGSDVQGSVTQSSRIGSQTIPPREGDITVFGQPPGNGVSADNWANHIASAGEYANFEFSVDKLKVLPGLRFEPWLISGTRELPPEPGQIPTGYATMPITVDPRLSITWSPASRLSFSVSGGIFHQAPDTGALSPVFGNPKLTLERAIHVSAAAQWKITPTLSMEVAGYYKWLDSLISRTEQTSPAEGQELTQDGVGRAYGGQVLFRQELTKGFFGWLAYSLGRSERKDHPNTAWRLFDYDQTHVLTLIASYTIGAGWEAGVRFRLTSGLPYTPVVGSFFDAASDAYQPFFGLHNSSRMPPFLALDARVEKTFTFRRLKVSIYLDVQNVTNQQNPEEVVYNFDYSHRYFITGLPVLPVIGLKVEL